MKVEEFIELHYNPCDAHGDTIILYDCGLACPLCNAEEKIEELEKKVEELERKKHPIIARGNVGTKKTGLPDIAWMEKKGKNGI
jgi:hypothetical protein